jgi:hypothetical protein
MAYKFDPVINTYVDPHSVEISKTLNQRFAQNFQIHNELEKQLFDMDAAGFENDQKLKNELFKTTQATLEARAKQGDFENLGFQVLTDAKNFSKAYKPLSENYARVQAYIKDVEDQYKAGKINSVARQEALGFSSNNYKGIEIDPLTGQAITGSLFNGVKIVQDPDILKKLNEGLARMKASGDTSKIKQIGQGPDAKFEVLTEKGWEGIKASDIKQVYDAIISEPDVTAFLQQQADFTTYKLNDQYLQNWANNSLEKYNSMLQQKGLDKNTIAQINNKITDLQAAGNDPAQLRALAKKSVIENKLQEYQTYAIKSTEYSKASSAYETSWDQKWLIDYKTIAENPELQKMSEVTANAIDGKTVDEKLTNVRAYIEQATKLEKEAQDTSLDPKVREEKLRSAKRFRDQASTIEQHIAQATDASYTIADFEKQDPTLFGIIKEMYPGKTAGEYAVIMARTFDSAWDQDYQNFEKAFDKKYGEGSFIKHFTRFYNASSAVEVGEGKTDWKWMTANRPELVRQDPSVNENDDPTAKIAVNFDKGFKNLMGDKFGWLKGDKVNGAIAELKISNPVQYGALPAMSTKESATATKAAKAYFEGLVIPEDATVTNVEEGEVKTLSGADLVNYKVARWGFMPKLGANGSWELQLVSNKEGEAPKTVIMSADEVTSPELQKYMNSPSVKFTQKVMSMDTGVKGNETVLDVTLNDDNNSKIQLHVKGDDPSNPLIAITKVNGEKTKYMRINDPALKSLVESGMLQLY